MENTNLDNIIFINEPKLSIHEADRDFNERRQMLVPQLKEFLTNHPLFFNKKINVTFITTGISCLVCIIDVTDKKYILKIPLSNLTSGLEGTFLKAWGDVGVKVPMVFEEGKIGTHFYTLMEYVESDTLTQKYSEDELIKNGIYKEMGKLLRKMHQVKTVGYSNIVNDKKEPEYSNVETWLASDPRTNEQIGYVKEHRLLTEMEHGSIEEVRDIIISHIGKNQETVYCHNDFHTENIFDTNPLTVFDPWPCFNHPYMDLARSIVLNARNKKSLDVSNQLVEGYFQNEEYDSSLLQAFVTLNVWVKFPYMHKTNRTKTMENLRIYLSQTKHLLKI